MSDCWSKRSQVHIPQSNDVILDTTLLKLKKSFVLLWLWTKLQMVNKKGTHLQIWLKSLVSPNKAEQLFRHKFQTIWTVRLHQLVVMQPCVATPSHQSILSPAEAKNVPIFFAVMRLMQSKVTRPIYLGSKNWVTVDKFFLVGFQFLIHFTPRKFFEWCHDAALAQWSALSTLFQRPEFEPNFVEQDWMNVGLLIGLFYMMVQVLAPIGLIRDVEETLTLIRYDNFLHTTQARGAPFFLFKATP